MPRHARPSRTARTSGRRPVYLAVSEHDLEDGTRERLELGPDEVLVVRERDGRRVAEAVPLKDLERIRTRGRVRQVAFLVALSYLLGAAVFLYLIVNLVDRLHGASLVLVLGILVFFAAGGVAAAWFGQEAVLQFLTRDRRHRVEYHVTAPERERLRILESLGEADERH